jgi:hypothetical protein
MPGFHIPSTAPLCWPVGQGDTLKAIQEAIEIFRELVEKHPTMHNDDLASAINNICSRNLIADRSHFRLSERPFRYVAKDDLGT